MFVLCDILIIELLYRIPYQNLYYYYMHKIIFFVLRLSVFVALRFSVHFEAGGYRRLAGHKAAWRFGWHCWLRPLAMMKAEVILTSMRLLLELLTIVEVERAVILSVGVAAIISSSIEHIASRQTNRTTVVVYAVVAGCRGCKELTLGCCCKDSSTLFIDSSALLFSADCKIFEAVWRPWSSWLCSS